MKASEVIRIGLKRSRAAVSEACSTLMPCACRSLANSTIRMAFLADRPITVIRPIWKYTSFGMPRNQTPNSVPSTPSGTTRITDRGMVQLSYSAARHRNTARIENAYRMVDEPPAFFSSSEMPVHS